MKIYIKLFIIFLVFNVLINFLLLNLFFTPKRIATLDLQSIKNDYILSIAGKNNNEKDIEQFIFKMQTTINKVAKENNLIILPKQIVFVGEDIDITDEFRRLIINDKYTKN